MTLRGYLPILLIVSNKGYMPIKSVAEKYLGREEVRSNCSPRHLWSFAASSSLSGKVETSGCIAAHLGLYSCSKFPPSLPRINKRNFSPLSERNSQVFVLVFFKVRLQSVSIRPWNVEVVVHNICFFAVAQRTRSFGLEIRHIVEFIVQGKLDLGESTFFRKRVLVLRVHSQLTLVTLF
jgi:hypothetical protein